MYVPANIIAAYIALKDNDIALPPYTEANADKKRHGAFFEILR